MNDRIMQVIEFVFHYVAIDIPNILLVDSDICYEKDSRGCCLNNYWIDYLFFFAYVCVELFLVMLSMIFYTWHISLEINLNYFGFETVGALYRMILDHN